MLNVVFVVYGQGDMTQYISQALSFINTNIPKGVTSETLAFDDTPIYHKWDDCFFLCPWNIPTEQKGCFTRICYAYFLLWKLKAGDGCCWSGGEWGPASGINNRAVCSAPYNVWWWDTDSNWGHGLKSGSAIIIHEHHHAMMSMLHDVFGYPISRSKEEHEYGKTVPHLDFMYDFGYGEGDDYVFTAWAYQQITEEMCNDLESVYVKTVSFDSVPADAEIAVVK